MTPLPRWVLLALLLVLAVAHPDDHACVCLCRARNGIPKIAEDCDHRRNHVLLSNGDWYLILRLVNLCLIPFSDPASLHHPLFHDSEFCRFFRDELIQYNSCSCDTLNNGKTEGIKEQQQYTFKTSEDAVATSADAEDQQGWRSKDLPEDKLKIPVVEDKLNSMDADSSKDETDSTEDPIDWDLWCIAQCDNGQGGSACNCDIIP